MQHQAGHSHSHHPPVALLVEDEVFLAMATAEMLEELGYEVIEALDARQALAALGDRPVSLMFTDIQLPGNMDGLELAHRVAEQWPDIRIVVASGQMLPSSHDLPESAKFLGKPYRQDQIRQTLV